MGAVQSNVLTVAVVEHVATVTFNRPDAYNSLDVELATALRDACRQLHDDPAVKVVVLKGEGRAFMAGGDLHALRAAPTEALHQLIPPVHEAVELLTAMHKPVIAMVHGAAAGAGLSIALAADFVIAAEGTRLSFAYSDIAASGDAGITWSLPRLVGLRRALSIAMLGGSVRIEQALAWGMISEVVAADELAPRVQALAEQLAGSHTYALGQIKRLMRSSLDCTLNEQLQREYDAFLACAEQPALTQAIDGFFSKRATK
jgi:2-(1,2-epoxy-1,2-dihydrophenyl)acetyl-CoA isomerase